MALTSLQDYRAQRAALLAGEAPTGSERRRRLAALTDGWLAGLFRASPAGAAGAGAGISLAAVGGQGRGDPAPCGDLDLVLLHRPDVDEALVAEVATALWYPVWDSGVRLDHAVRTPADARTVAAGDVPALLGMLDLRHVAGDEALTAEVRSSVLGDYRAAAFRRLPHVLVHARSRARRAGELAFLLEPDVKEAAGGLREFAVLRAVAASWLADVPWARLHGPREVLLDVRDALHLVTGRECNRLMHQEQREVACLLGYADPDELLRAVSTAGRTVQHAIEETARLVSRAVAARDRHRGGNAGRPAPWRPLSAGVLERDGEVALDSRADPAKDPQLVLRVSAAAARAALPIAPATVRRLTEAAQPCPPWPAPARELFVSLLGAGRGLVDVWESLQAAGVVTRLLPEWEAVRSLPQHNPVHRHTVDRHSIEAVVHAAPLLGRVSRPDLLLLAALCHDLGKGVPGPGGDVDHPESGVQPTATLTRRVGFDDADSAVVCTLVRHHLLLATVATDKDPSDPATVRQVRAAVDSPDVLDLLHALTEADARATGSPAWSAWRAACVEGLVHRVRASFGCR